MGFLRADEFQADALRVASGSNEELNATLKKIIDSVLRVDQTEV